MGIRFYCPNGHKLNVKAHQAGKIGICPECGVKCRIPLESTRLSTREIKKIAELPPEEQNELSPLSSSGGQEAQPFSESSESPAASSVQDNPVQASLTIQEQILSDKSPLSPRPAESDVSSMETPENGNNLAAEEANADEPKIGLSLLNSPLEESEADEVIIGLPASDKHWEEIQNIQDEPEGEILSLQSKESDLEDAVAWFVQGKNQQNYGPISTETIHQWIEEHRISPDMLVWQKDWPQWKSAREVFPELDAIFAASKEVPLPAAVPSEPQNEINAGLDELKASVRASQSSSESRRKEKLQKKKQRAVRDLLIMISLIVIIMALVVVLFVVLKKGGGEAAQTDAVSLNQPENIMSAQFL